MVDCAQFLEGYSAYRDGELGGSERSRFEAHLAACPSCARYDRVIEEGLRHYRQSAELRPSDDFLPRLQHRIYHLEEEMRGAARTASGTQVSLTLAIAAMLAIAAWAPALRPKPGVMELAPVAARAPLAQDAPLQLFGADAFSAPSPLGFEGWLPEPAPPADDLLFRYSPGPARYRVQPVMQH